MNKEEFTRMLLEEWKKGYIYFQTIDGINKAKIEDFVKQPLEGQLYDINRDLTTILTLIDKQSWLNNYACMRLVEYYYNRCKELESKLKKYDEQEAKRSEERR